MKTVNMHEAKTHLSRLVEEAAAGEMIVIARAGKPLVRLVAVTATDGPRKLGALAGKVTEAPDTWAADPKIESLFYEGDVEPRGEQRVAERTRKPRAKSSRKKK
jgi:prevent-host-death family protein